MFLSRLNKEEKVAFLELAYFMSKSDGDFSKQEQEMILTYCVEMDIANIQYKEKDFCIDRTLLKITSKQSQKIVLLELMALGYSDNILHHEEKKVLEKIIKNFELDMSLVDVYANWSKAMLALALQGEALINI